MANMKGLKGKMDLYVYKFYAANVKIISLIKTRALDSLCEIISKAIV